MKRKILFVCYGLGFGGIEKCLVNLINNMPEGKYDVDLLLMNPETELKSDIRRKLNCIDSFYYVMNTTDTYSEIRYRGGIVKNFERFITYCIFRVANKLRLPVWKLFRRLPEKYDVAIAYSQNDFSTYYVIDKVSAKRKVMWYHNGAYEGDRKKQKRDSKYYSKFDYIVAVSSDCKRVLQKYFTLQDDQLIVLRNFCNVKMILEKADKFVPQTYKNSKIHIVSVGRMTKEKGTELAVDACEWLKKQGLDICWHWVGDGNCRGEIQKKIQEKELNHNFILEGNKKNPYPYIKRADIYVQPSFYEAYSTTITEAKVLCKPIVTTDVGGMRDQIRDGVNGLIVPIEALEIARAVRKLIDNRNIADNFVKRLKNESMDIKQIMESYENTVFSNIKEEV